MQRCPFCSIENSSPQITVDTYDHYFVVCLGCRAQGPKGRNKSEAELWWNVRDGKNSPPVTLANFLIETKDIELSMNTHDRFQQLLGTDSFTVIYQAPDGSAQMGEKLYANAEECWSCEPNQNSSGWLKTGIVKWNINGIRVVHGA